MGVEKKKIGKQAVFGGSEIYGVGRVVDSGEFSEDLFLSKPAVWLGFIIGF